MGLYRRHNYLRDALLQQCLDAGVVAHANGLPIPELGDRPADLFLDNLGGGSPAAVDVSIVSGLQPSRPSATTHAGVFATRREETKQELYGENCRAIGWRFIPFAGETTGAWGPGAHKFMSHLTSLSSSRLGEPKSVASQRLWRLLSSALAKAVSEQLIRAFGSAM
jgi:hypothetical protein